MALKRKIKYLFRDDFTSELAAGAVNGTLTPDGKVYRVVTDTASKAIIFGGLGFGGGKAVPAFGDPGYWMDTLIARTVGRMLVAHFRVMVEGNFTIGFDADKIGTSTVNALWVIGTDLRSFDSGGGGQSIGTISQGQDYYLTLVLRAAGCHYFILGGPEYPKNTLIWTHTSNTLAGYPQISGKDAVFTCGYIRIPQALWMPCPIASDSFNRANGAIGQTDGAGHAEAAGLGAGGAGLVWTNQQGTIAITSNKAQASALASGVGIATVDTGQADVNLDLTVAWTGGVSGVVLRYVDADNYIYAGFDGTNWNLVKRVAGTETTLQTAVAVIGLGAIKVYAHGSIFRAYRNGTLIGAVSTIADAALQSSGKHGIYTTNTANTADNLTIRART